MTISTKERVLRFIVGSELVVALVSFAIQWLVYSSDMNHSCVGRSFHDHWKGAVFCVNRNEQLAWKAISAISSGAILALFATVAMIKIYQYLTDPTATRNSR